MTANFQNVLNELDAIGADTRPDLAPLAKAIRAYGNAQYDPLWMGMDVARGEDVSLRRTIEGTAIFMRDATSRSPCVCCPPGEGHIFARHVKWDEWETNRPAHFSNSADVLISKMLDANETEGKRIRVTVEVLDTDNAAGAPHPTGTGGRDGANV